MPFGFLGKLAGSIGGGIKSGGTFNEMASIEWRQRRDHSETGGSGAVEDRSKAGSEEKLSLASEAKF